MFPVSNNKAQPIATNDYIDKTAELAAIKIIKLENLYEIENYEICTRFLVVSCRVDSACL